MKIPIIHLKDGEHHFNEVIRTTSLSFYRKEVYQQDLHASVRVNKHQDILYCDVTLETTGHFTCDRCLKAFTNPVKTTFPLLIQIGEGAVETDEGNVISLDRDTVEVDLTETIFEYLALEAPMKAVCREDCRGFCAGCGADLNRENCRCESTDIDPRWEKLRSLRRS